jgi:hypothetical protein
MRFPKTKTPRDPKYLQWLRAQQCAFCGAPPPSEVSHHGRRGVGLKASDHLALPSCHGCHQRHHSKLSSPHRRYDGMNPDQRRDAYARLAERHRARYLERC